MIYILKELPCTLHKFSYLFWGSFCSQRNKENLAYRKIALSFIIYTYALFQVALRLS